MIHSLHFKSAEFWALSGINPPSPCIRTSVQFIGLTPPPHPFFNYSGAAKGNPGLAGAGGQLRDCNGVWVKGFTRNLGFTSSVSAELWALRDGFKLALDMGISDL